MKIEPINISVIGIKQKDYEFIGINRNCSEFKIIFHNKKNDADWNICIYGIVEYKLSSTELTNQGNLNLPKEGVVFEFLDSPWIDEFERALIMDINDSPIFEVVAEKISVTIES